MNIRNAVRTLAAAALLAMTVVTVSAQQANARPIGPRQIDGPVVFPPRNTTCAVQGSAVGQPQYDWVFYAFLETITVNGQEYMCGFVNGGGYWISV